MLAYWVQHSTDEKVEESSIEFHSFFWTTDVLLIGEWKTFFYVHHAQYCNMQYFLSLSVVRTRLIHFWWSKLDNYFQHTLLLLLNGWKKNRINKEINLKIYKHVDIKKLSVFTSVPGNNCVGRKAIWVHFILKINNSFHKFISRVFLFFVKEIKFFPQILVFLLLHATYCTHYLLKKWNFIRNFPFHPRHAFWGWKGRRNFEAIRPMRKIFWLKKDFLGIL